jgi:hypothetical protein
MASALRRRAGVHLRDRAHTLHGDGLAHGAFDADADGVAGLPVRGVLPGTVGLLLVKNLHACLPTPRSDPLGLRRGSRSRAGRERLDDLAGPLVSPDGQPASARRSAKHGTTRRG